MMASRISCSLSSKYGQFSRAAKHSEAQRPHGCTSKLEKIKVISGANKPLKRPSHICGEIHGQSGLGGVDWDEIDKKIESLGISLSSGEKKIHQM